MPQHEQKLNPAVQLNVNSDTFSTKLSFILDTGAEFSLIDLDILKKFKVNTEPTTRKVTSVNGDSEILGFESILTIELPNGETTNVSFFWERKYCSNYLQSFLR